MVLYCNNYHILAIVQCMVMLWADVVLCYEVNLYVNMHSALQCRGGLTRHIVSGKL